MIGLPGEPFATIDVPFAGEIPCGNARRVVAKLGGQILDDARANPDVVLAPVDVLARLGITAERVGHDLHVAAGTVDAGCDIAT
ncbi:MAG: hypothetical protein WC997_02490 [Porticoccaceae bacterium]